MSFNTALPESFLYGAAAGSIGFYTTLWLTQVATLKFPDLEKRVLALKDKPRYYFWALGPSTLHALVQCLGTAAFLPKMRNDPIIGMDQRLWVEYGLTGLGPSFFSGIFVGYLLADFIFLGPSKLGTAYVFHHLSASVCWTMAQTIGSFQFVAQLLQFCEFSTIFMNLRQLYLTAGYDSSTPQVVWASLVFFASFGLVRVAPLPQVLYRWINQDFTIIRNEIGMGAALLFSAFFTVHAVLQTMWFGIMIQRLIAKSGGAGSSKKKKQEGESKED